MEDNQKVKYEGNEGNLLTFKSNLFIVTKPKERKPN